MQVKMENLIRDGDSGRKYFSELKKVKFLISRSSVMIPIRSKKFYMCTSGKGTDYTTILAYFRGIYS